MKKVLLFGFVIAMGMFYACEKKTEGSLEYRDLGDEVTNLKATAPSKTSIFENFNATLNLPLDKELKDSKTGAIVKIGLDSVVCRHQLSAKVSERIPGSFVTTSDTSITFTVDGEVMLDEPYILNMYFTWYNKDGSEIKDNNGSFYRSLYTEYNPTVVDGKDIKFSTTRTKENDPEIIVYDGDMIVDFVSNILFDSIGGPVSSAKEDVGFLVQNIDVVSNYGDDYNIWKEEIDSIEGRIHYLPQIPEGENHLVPNIFYTINLKLDYVINKNGVWQPIINSKGDTATWDYKKTIGTSDLFVPNQILANLSPEKGNVAIDTIPIVQLSGTDSLIVTERDIFFRPVLSKFELLKGTDKVKTNFKWVEQGEYPWADKPKMGATLEPDSLYLVPGFEFTVAAEAYWEFKTNKDSTNWMILKNTNGQVTETLEGTFKSALTKPGVIVNNITPDNDLAGMMQDVVVDFKHPIGKVTTSGNIEFKSVLDAFTLTQSDTLVNDNFELSDQNATATMKEDDMYYPNTNYKAIVNSHWEYKDKDGVWKQYNLKNSKIKETSEQSFQTVGRPVSIYKGWNLGRLNDITVKPNLYFNITRGEKYLVNLDQVEFKPVVDSGFISLGSDENIRLDHTITWVGDTMQIFDYGKMYDANTTYRLFFFAHWEYRKVSDGASAPWRVHPDPTNVCNERPTRTFTTSGKPGEIISSYYPQGEAVSVSDTAAVFTNYIIDSNLAHAGTIFKAIKDSSEIYTENTLVETTQATLTIGSGDAQRSVLVMKPNKDLDYGKDYALKGAFHWEYLLNGVWTRLPESEEIINHSFKTIADNTPAAE